MPTEVQPEIPKGLATQAGLTTAILGAVGGVVNLIADGPLEATVTPIAGAFMAVLALMLGRYWQAAKVPPTVARIARTLDEVADQIDWKAVAQSLAQSTPRAKPPMDPIYPNPRVDPGLPPEPKA